MSLYRHNANQRIKLMQECQVLSDQLSDEESSLVSLKKQIINDLMVARATIKSIDELDAEIADKKEQIDDLDDEGVDSFYIQEVEYIVGM